MRHSSYGYLKASDPFSEWYKNRVKLESGHLCRDKKHVSVCRNLPVHTQKSWNSNSVRKCCFRRGFPYISKLLCNYTGWIHTNRERSELERDSKEESKWEQRERKDSHRSQVWTLMVKKKQTATLLKRKSWRFSKHIATVTNRGQRHLNRFSHRCFFPTVRTQMEPHTGISLLRHYMSVRFMYLFIFIAQKHLLKSFIIHMLSSPWMLT